MKNDDISKSFLENSKKSCTFVYKYKRNMTLYLLVYPKRCKVNSQNKSPLFLRVSLNGQRAEIALKRFVSPDSWDNKRQCVKGRSPDAQSINEQIRVFKLTVYNHFTRLLNEGENLTADRLKQAFLGVDKSRKTIIEAFAYHNDKMSKLVGREYAKGTYDRYMTCLRLLSEFIQNHYKEKDIELEKLNLEFITEFEFYLRTKRNCNNNTTVKYLKNLKKIINLARALNWINHDPYLNYKSKLETVNRVILTQSEIDMLLNKSFEVKRLEYIKDIFLFCCFTGLAYSDVKKLSKDNVFVGIDGSDWIQINRTKTNVLSKIPILPMAEVILEKYKNNPECIKRNKLLPVPSNQKYNSYLKEIADCCGLAKNLTSHIARHTFATTITLNNRVPIETVSNMLGHRSLRTTQHYSKVLEVKISDDMSGLREIYQSKPLLKAIKT